MLACELHYRCLRICLLEFLDERDELKGSDCNMVLLSMTVPSKYVVA